MDRCQLHKFQVHLKKTGELRLFPESTKKELFKHYMKWFFTLGFYEVV